MYFKELLEEHPEILRDRHDLVLSRRCPAAETASAYARSGVVMLKDALSPATLDAGADGFRRLSAPRQAA